MHGIVTGATFKAQQLPKAEWLAKNAKFGPFAEALWDMFNSIAEFNCESVLYSWFSSCRFTDYTSLYHQSDYGKKDLEASQKKAGIVPPSFSEQLKSYKPEMFLQGSPAH